MTQAGAAVQLRPIEDADVAAVVALWKRAGVFRPWNDPERDIAFARRGDHSVLLVAESAGVIVASAMVGEDGHRGWAYYVAVDPDAQGRGFGRAIMAAAEAWLRARGVWKFQVMIRRDNVAVQDFYAGLGFAPSDVVVMQKVIEPG